MVDRTLKSNYYYSVPQSALQLMTNIGKGANIDQQSISRGELKIQFKKK